MAIDVIVNPEAGCIAVVHDEGAERFPDAIVMDGRALFVVAEGRSSLVGELTPGMAAAAGTCRAGVVVAMEGPRIARSRRVRLVIDGAER